MIIGSMQVEVQELRKYLSSVPVFREYAKSLVPEEYRHIKEIVDNQVYYNLLVLRKTESIHWQVKKELIIEIANSVKLTGLIDKVFDIAALEHCVNEERVRKFYSSSSIR